MVEDLRVYRSSNCGCMEATGVISMFEVLVHVDPGGQGEAFVDAGDWQDVLFFDCRGIYDLLCQTGNYLRALPQEGAL